MMAFNSSAVAGFSLLLMHLHCMQYWVLVHRFSAGHLVGRGGYNCLASSLLIRHSDAGGGTCTMKGNG